MPKPAHPEPVEGPLTPGTYLRLRREKAGLSLAEAARMLVYLEMMETECEPITPAMRTVREQRAASMLNAAEWDAGTMAITTVALLSHIFPFSIDVHEDLLTLHFAGLVDCADAAELPVPRCCHACACSWHDPCHTAPQLLAAVSFPSSTCAWSASDPTRCSRCVDTPALTQIAEGAPA